jgi:hypothetical protein
MSSSPLEEDDVHVDSQGMTTSSRQTSQEANLSFVTISSGEPTGSRDFESSFETVDSYRHNSFETVSETLASDETEFCDVGNERKLTKRERKKQVLTFLHLNILFRR